jgi:hypothetical protein
MSTKAIVPGALVLVLFGGWAARGAEVQLTPLPNPSATQPDRPDERRQEPEVLPAPSPARSTETTPTSQASSLTFPPGTVADPWIAYTKPDCCGPIGADGPIGTEWFLRNGIVLPVAGGVLNDALQAGWMFEFGGRALLYNASTDAAWTGSVGLSHTYNNANRSDLVFTINEAFPEINPLSGQQTGILFGDIPVTIRDYQRTSFNIAFGREWNLLSPAYSPGRHLRIGFDNGGRWGWGEVGLNDLGAIDTAGILFRRRSDVFGSYFLALYSVLEIPICCGQKFFVTGFRAEWNYTWTDALKETIPANELQDVNLLWHIGCRY